MHAKLRKQEFNGRSHMNNATDITLKWKAGEHGSADCGNFWQVPERPTSALDAPANEGRGNDLCEGGEVKLAFHPWPTALMPMWA